MRVVICLAILLVANFPSGKSLRCYECDTSNQKCADPTKLEESMVRECSSTTPSTAKSTEQSTEKTTTITEAQSEKGDETEATTLAPAVTMSTPMTTQEASDYEVPTTPTSPAPALSGAVDPPLKNSSLSGDNVQPQDNKTTENKSSEPSLSNVNNKGGADNQNETKTVSSTPMTTKEASDDEVPTTPTSPAPALSGAVDPPLKNSSLSGDNVQPQDNKTTENKSSEPSLSNVNNKGGADNQNETKTVSSTPMTTKEASDDEVPTTPTSPAPALSGAVDPPLKNSSLSGDNVQPQDNKTTENKSSEPSLSNVNNKGGADKQNETKTVSSTPMTTKKASDDEVPTTPTSPAPALSGAVDPPLKNPALPGDNVQRVNNKETENASKTVAQKEKTDNPLPAGRKRRDTNTVQFVCFKQDEGKNVIRGCRPKSDKCDSKNGCNQCEKDKCNSSSNISIGIFTTFLSLIVAFGLSR